MQVNIKVAGTTFHPLPAGVGIAIEEEFVEKSVPCATATAILAPEPENPYDPLAVKVIIRLTNGQAFHLGYLPKLEPMKKEIDTFTLAKLVIKDYRQVGSFNPSYIIREIEGR